MLKHQKLNFRAALFTLSFPLLATFFILPAIAGSSTQIKIQDQMYNLHVLDKAEFPEAIKVIEEAKKFSSQFQKNEISEPIDNCGFMIDLPVNARNGNHSYGEYCNTKTTKTVKGKQVIVCGDLLVGHFKAEEFMIEDFNLPRDMTNLAEFVATHCTGG